MWVPKWWYSYNKRLESHVKVVMTAVAYDMTG